MELDGRHYVQCDVSDDALEVWRRHSCLSRLSSAQREAAYSAASPLLCAAAHSLVQHYAWRAAVPSPAELFNIQHPTTNTHFALPHTLELLFTQAATCASMFGAVFPVHKDQDGCLCVAGPGPLADVFHLLQLLAPGCFALVNAEYATHEVDDEGEVAWITWHTYTRALPPPTWMDLHAQQSPHLFVVFGEKRWTSLRRAAADFEVLTGGDVTFA